jgi:hypothetical protein
VKANRRPLERASLPDLQPNDRTVERASLPARPSRPPRDFLIAGREFGEPPRQPGGQARSLYGRVTMQAS